MTATFTWPVQTTSSGDGEFRTTESRFGDGYSQDTPNGINNETQKWSVVYSGYRSQVDTVLAFIRAQKGMSFFWKPPLAPVGYYKCKKYNVAPQGGGYYVLSMDFEQGYAP